MPTSRTLSPLFKSPQPSLREKEFDRRALSPHLYRQPLSGDRRNGPERVLRDLKLRSPSRLGGRVHPAEDRSVFDPLHNLARAAEGCRGWSNSPVVARDADRSFGLALHGEPRPVVLRYLRLCLDLRPDLLLRHSRVRVRPKFSPYLSDRGDQEGPRERPTP